MTLLPGSISLAAWRTGVRFHLRPVRRLMERTRPGASPSRTWGVVLGPFAVGTRTVHVRSPRLADASEWRRLRLLNRERIEPWWVSSDLSWEERHSDAEWMSHYLHMRRAAIAGKALPLVVEVDGRFAGQCNLEWIDLHNGNAELGVWLDEAIAGKGLTGVATAAVVDYAFGPLGLHRLSAPIADGNDLAAWGAEALGMRHEGLMAGYLDVGGKRRAHHLWAMTRDDLPEGGMMAFATAVASGPRGPRRDARPASG